MRRTGGKICPICNDYRSFHTEWKGEKLLVLCLCETLKQIDEQHDTLGRFETPVKPSSLDILQPIAVPTPKAAEDLQNLLKFVNEWVKAPRSWWIVSGNTGCGKSHILWSIKTMVPYLFTYVSAERFQSHVFQSLKENTTQELIDTLSLAPGLLFDDWGLDHKSSFTTDTLAAIVNRRYMYPDEYPTVMTTNLAIGGLLDSPDDATRRIASRMVDREKSRVFQLRQSDMRDPRTAKAAGIK